MPIQSTGSLNISGRQINLQIDWRPTQEIGPDTTERFNEALEKMRQKIVLDFSIPSQEVGVCREGEYIPTGPVVEGSIEK